MTDIIKSVRKFTVAVGCTTDQFNARQTALYTGLQLEELAEKLDAIGLYESSERLHDISQSFKAGTYDRMVDMADRAAMLDADVDLAWVTIGSMLSQGADVEGACGEVARANISKLQGCDVCQSLNKELRGAEYVCDAFDCNGLGLIAIKDDNGKVKKPEEWTPPNIEPFVCNR